MYTVKWAVDFFANRDVMGWAIFERCHGEGLVCYIGPKARLRALQDMDFLVAHCSQKLTMDNLVSERFNESPPGRLDPGSLSNPEVRVPYRGMPSRIPLFLRAEIRFTRPVYPEGMVLRGSLLWPRTYLSLTLTRFLGIRHAFDFTQFE